MEQTITIQNKKGLHARAAAKFVKLVESHDAEIAVIKGDVSVGGQSIMGLLMLGASIGSEITIKSSGTQGEEALSALVSLINRRFDEE